MEISALIKNMEKTPILVMTVLEGSFENKGLERLLWWSSG